MKIKLSKAERKRRSDSQRERMAALSPLERHRRAKKAGMTGTPEERRERGKKASDAMSSEERSRLASVRAKRMWATMTPELREIRRDRIRETWARRSSEQRAATMEKMHQRNREAWATRRRLVALGKMVEAANQGKE